MSRRVAAAGPHDSFVGEAAFSSLKKLPYLPLIEREAVLTATGHR